jgi:Catalase
MLQRCPTLSEIEISPQLGPTCTPTHHHHGEENGSRRNTEPLTTAAGAPVTDNQNSMSAGAHGPLLLQDLWLIETLAHFAREVIPDDAREAEEPSPPSRNRAAISQPCAMLRLNGASEVEPQCGDLVSGHVVNHRVGHRDSILTD